jgi:hypothetical protein
MLIDLFLTPAKVDGIQLLFPLADQQFHGILIPELVNIVRRHAGKIGNIGITEAEAKAEAKAEVKARLSL